jgi:hypothetical protein
MSIIVRLLGLAAFVAAARAAWLHHQDNQAVIRTDLIRDAFAAGQAAERTRAGEQADTERRAGYLSSLPAPGLVPHLRQGGRLEWGPPEEAAPAPEEARVFPFDMTWPEDLGWPAEGWTIHRDNDADPPVVTYLPPGVDGTVEPEGHGWIEWGDGHGGTSR